MNARLELAIDADALISELTELAAFSACPDPPPAVTRVVFTEEDLRAREYLAGRYAEAGLTVRVDAVGNTFARWTGKEPELPAVATGSHCDAIPFAGMYDGTVGVLGGLEAIRALRRTGWQPRRSIELVMITSEEPTRFGIGCTGSRVLAGLLDDDDLGKLCDADGDSYNIVRQRAGFTGNVSEAAIASDHYHAWVELHIEQGPELEAKDLPIGIVTAIAAPATMLVEIKGQGGHAGGVLMPARHDALCAAAEMITLIEGLAKNSSSPDCVATVGKLTVHPGAVNSIASLVTLTVDLRDIDQANRDAVKSNIERQIQEISARRGVTSACKTLNVDPPAIADEGIIAAAEHACGAVGLPFQRMVSRAYHDSLFMAQVAPMGMLFIPCRAGVSHRPDEFSTPHQIATGVEVLARTLASLAS